MDESIMRTIRQQMDGRTASDAQILLNYLIEKLNAEQEALYDLPKDQTVVWKDGVPPSPAPPVESSSFIPLPSTSSIVLSSVTSLPIAATSVIDIASVGPGPTLSTERPLIVTQTVYVTATPSIVATTSTATPQPTNSGVDNSIAELMNKYNAGAHDKTVPIMILLALFGTVLFIGIVTGLLWWRKGKQRRKQQAIDHEREMEEQRRRPPYGYAYEQFMASKHGLHASQPQDDPKESSLYTGPAVPPSNSKRPSMTSLQTHHTKKFKGKASNLPTIDTSSRQVEDPPISPTFVPLPGTPMKLVSRQQVFQDPQRRRGVDALDLAAQQESNQKHWKTVIPNHASTSNAAPKRVDVASTGDEGERPTII
jgi:hypothetical protein